MKTFLKNNMIAVFALLLSIGTMSFKLAENKEAANQWYYVDQFGNIQGTSPGPDGTDCVATIVTDLCQIELNDNHPKPATVGQAQTLGLVEAYAGRP